MKSIKLVVLGAILIGSIGCTKEPALKVYSLETPIIGAVQNSAYRNKSIKVIYPRSIKNNLSQKMNFSYSSSDSGIYLNSEWSNDMGKLLQGTFIEVLDASHLFKVVLSDSSTIKEEYRLESNIFAFYHSVRGAASHAIVSIQFNLISMKTGHLVKSKRFSYKELTPTTDANGYASATNKVIVTLSKDLLQWLK